MIDLFAGPGGLGEGFSSLRDKNGNPIFQSILSIECDKSAHSTLRLRAYLRKLLQYEGKIPRAYNRYMSNHDIESLNRLISYRPSLWELANTEALCATLVENDDSYVELGRERIEKWRMAYGDGPLVVIGGPPCQAYSLAGRSRRVHDEAFANDIKHTLYRCYLSFLAGLNPDIFVMENVKGLLSATHEGHRMFSRIMGDMEDAGYEIRSLVVEDPLSSRDFIVRSELYGIPQTRHRVILLGVRKKSGLSTGVLTPRQMISLGEALAGMPRIRSGFSASNPSSDKMNWSSYINSAARRILKTDEGASLEPSLRRVISSRPPKLEEKTRVDACEGPYDEWYRGQLGRSRILTSHVARSHLAADLDRYLFCAAYAEIHNRPPHLDDFPAALLPNHKNVQEAANGSYKFNDRFHVQMPNRPSTTITSHIAKDGHYYIHPDPVQCRSLTVREAARLQTFPDDYYFEGNRTSQYIQVGNAVPPLLAQQIGAVVAQSFSIASQGFYEKLIPFDGHSGDCDCCCVG